MKDKNAVRRAIVLAGGSGTRLYPATLAVSKQLLPVYDKPLIYYPLSVLMLAELRDILLISTPEHQECFRRLLGDGSQLGMRISYAVQPKPEGIAQALLIGREFIGEDSVALVLGDNLFFGQNFRAELAAVSQHQRGATIFAYPVRHAERYCVVEFDDNGDPRTLVEKPPSPKSNWAVPGLYFYDQRAVRFAEQLRPSARGELEITDVNREYLRLGELRVRRFSRGFTWLDAGTHESLMQAANFVQAVEERQGLKIACLEEIAYRMGFIDATQLAELAEKLPGAYGMYVRRIVSND